MTVDMWTFYGVTVAGFLGRRFLCEDCEGGGEGGEFQQQKEDF